eukprot:491968-Hanusia_phi.AAC.1
MILSTKADGEISGRGPWKAGRDKGLACSAVALTVSSSMAAITGTILSWARASLTMRSLKSWWSVSVPSKSSVQLPRDVEGPGAYGGSFCEEALAEALQTFAWHILRRGKGL